MSNEEMGAPHPDLIGLAAFVDGRLSEAERRACVSHLAQCAECRAIVATYARGAAPESGSGAAAASVAARPRFRGVPAWLPIAATLMLATTAAIAWWRMDANVAPASPPSIAPSAPSPSGPAPASPQPAPPPSGVAPSQPASPSAPQTPDLIGPRRSGERVVGGKTFRLVAGEWIDVAYDPLGLLKVENVEGPDARAAMLARLPALAEYAALGPRVTVVVDGTVYRFR